MRNVTVQSLFRTITSIIILMLLASFARAGGSVTSGASDSLVCHDAKIFQNILTDFCWSCIYPIRVAGFPLISGKAPDEAVSTVACACEDNLGIPRPGLTTSMWEPSRLIEFQTTPGCSSVLGGIRFPFRRTMLGTHGNGELDAGDPSYHHYHYYAFPVLAMMDLFVGHCSDDNYVDLDLMYLSEVDPTWTNDELAFFTNPEAAAVANPAAVLACIPDAIASTAGKPIKQLFWCAGSWGTLYPLSGNTHGGHGTVVETSLLKSRTLAALHRRGLAMKTMGRSGMCGGIIHPTLPKTQYKFSLLFPIPESKSAHVMGESTMTWGLSRTIPAVGEDLIYTIWRWNDCCNN